MNELYEVTNEVIDRHTPARKLTNKEFKRRHKRWITSAILNSIGWKNKLYKKYIKCINTVTRNQIFQENKTLKNQITQIIRVSKKQHFARYFSANNNNLRKLLAPSFLVELSCPDTKSGKKTNLSQTYVMQPKKRNFPKFGQKSVRDFSYLCISYYIGTILA